MKWLALVLLAGPAAADCFTGQPHQVTFSDGKVMQVLDRKGDDVTVAWSDEVDIQRVSRMMMFHLETRTGGKVEADRWVGRLPKSADLVPGFTFDVQGSFTGSDGKPNAKRLTGTVLAADTVTVGGCAYETTVIKQDYFLNGEWLYFTTDYLRTDMMILLRSDIQPAGAEAITRMVTAIQ
jgi:hypothetical protein